MKDTNPTTLREQIEEALGYHQTVDQIKALEVITLEFAIIQMREFYYDSAVENACDKLRERLQKLKSPKP